MIGHYIKEIVLSFKLLNKGLFFLEVFLKEFFEFLCQ